MLYLPAQMLPNDAFDAIKAAVEADPQKRLVNSRYWPEAFGNFIIAFEDAGSPRSVVLDRFELVLCEDLNGDEGCKTILQSIREAEPDEVIARLGF